MRPKSQNVGSKLPSSALEGTQEKAGANRDSGNDETEADTRLPLGLLYFRPLDADALHHLPLHEPFY